MENERSLITERAIESRKARAEAVAKKEKKSRAASERKVYPRERNVALNIRLTQAERDSFEALYKQSGKKSRAAFLMALVDEKPIVDTTPFIALRNDLKRIGSNINQVAAAYNKYAIELSTVAEKLRDAIRRLTWNTTGFNQTLDAFEEWVRHFQEGNDALNANLALLMGVVGEILELKTDLERVALKKEG